MELPTFGQTIRMAMRLDPDIYWAIVVAPNGLRMAIWVVILASFSEAMGQSIVLFLNNVRPRRFALALGISSISNMIGYLLWVGVVWLVLRFVYDIHTPAIVLASAVGLAYAPQLLGFFELLPYWGNPFGIILSLWTMLAITVAIDVITPLTIWQAALASAMGWALIQLWRRTLGVPIYAFGNWIQRRVAGSPMQFNLGDIPDLRRQFYLTENIEKWREMLSSAKWEEWRETMRTERFNFNLNRRFNRQKGIDGVTEEGKDTEGNTTEGKAAEKTADASSPDAPPPDAPSSDSLPSDSLPSDSLSEETDRV